MVKSGGGIVVDWIWRICNMAFESVLCLITGGRERVEISCLSYANDLVLYGESEEELKVKVGRFVELCRRGLEVNAIWC